MATPAQRAALQAAAQQAVQAAGSQAALARELGVSPRMIRHALAGNKGFNLQTALTTRAAPAGGSTAARVAYQQNRRPAPGRRQPVQRIGSTAQLQSQRRQTMENLDVNQLQRRMIDGAASSGGRVSIRVEYRDASGNVQTGHVFRKGGINAAVLQTMLAQGLSLADVVAQHGGASGLAAGATVTGVTVTTF